PLLHHARYTHPATVCQQQWIPHTQYSSAYHLEHADATQPNFTPHPNTRSQDRPNKGHTKSARCFSWGRHRVLHDISRFSGIFDTFVEVLKQYFPRLLAESDENSTHSFSTFRIPPRRQRRSSLVYRNIGKTQPCFYMVTLSNQVGVVSRTFRFHARQTCFGRVDELVN
ncbi:unnamed protein product, partial [Ectocarpus fasciculatus]